METLEDMTSQGQMQLQHAVVTNRSVTAPLQESMLSLDLGQEDSSATHHAEVSVGDDESYIRDTTTEGEERANSKHRVVNTSISRHHTPPAEQRQGSWIYDQVSNRYILTSYSTSRGRVNSTNPTGRMLTEKVMFELLDLEDFERQYPNSQFLQPNSIPITEFLVSGYQWPPTLCTDCKAMCSKILHDFAKAKSQTLAVRAQYVGLDVDLKPSLGELIKSANDKCQSCRFLVDEFEAMPSEVLRDFRSACGNGDTPIQVTGHEDDDGFWGIKVWLRNPLDTRASRRLNAFGILAHVGSSSDTSDQTPSRVETAKYFVAGRHLTSDFLSLEYRTLMFTWMEECARNHPHCPKVEPDLPTRVLDVGDDANPPRLVVSNGKQAPYVALSYCWGQGKQLTTTISTLHQRQAGIELQELPKTVRDAVMLARSLRVRYIWVDALCIIQDSKEDWRVEAARMGYVYQNACLTIAVPESSSCTEGFLHEKTQRQQSLSVPCLNYGCHVVFDPLPRDWDLAIEKGALNQRAWTFQERLLSPRVLFMGRQQVFWECKGVRSAAHHYVVKGTRYVKLRESVHSRIPKQATTGTGLGVPSATGASENDGDYWYRLVESYCLRSLSYPSDKLPALAGVASFLARNEEDVYLAGIWLSEWRRGLCWQASTARSLYTPSSLQEPRAPSWSWSHLDGAIKFLDVVGKGSSSTGESPAGKEERDDEEDSGHLSSLNARLLSTSHTTSDYIGSLTNISLTLTGHATRIAVRSSTQQPRPPSSYNGWVGIYDDFNQNWFYRLDTNQHPEPVECLRFCISCSGQTCYALLLVQQRALNEDSSAEGRGGRWTRIGIGCAHAYMVDFKRLMGELWTVDLH